MRKLLKVEDSWRGFTFRSLFIADEADWGRIQAWCADGKSVYFGEVAGKHSDLSMTFNLDDFKVVSEDQHFIDQFESTIGFRFGHDVLGHMADRCEECGEYLSDDETSLCAWCDKHRG